MLALKLLWEFDGACITHAGGPGTLPPPALQLPVMGSRRVPSTAAQIVAFGIGFHLFLRGGLVQSDQVLLGVLLFGERIPGLICIRIGESASDLLGD